MSEIELKACPFCGPGQSVVGLWHDDVAQRWRVGCGRCGCSTGTSPRDKTEAPAIKAWNTRAPQWQPIETAPKDGEGILGFISATWIEGIFWNGSEWSYLSDGDITPLGRHQPTHWQPLPAAPEVEG